MAQLLIDILGSKWDLWQVPSVETAVWPQSLLWCLVDVDWVVAHSRWVEPGVAGSLPPRTVRGLKHRCRLCKAQDSGARGVEVHLPGGQEEDVRLSWQATGD